MALRNRAAKLESSGIMRYLFTGWFSATAEWDCSAKYSSSKREAAHRGAML
jgi:hypothetical protein